MLKKVVVLGILAFAVCAYGAEPVGTWTGKIQVDTSKLPADKKALVEKQTSNLKITLNLKKDHTFTSTVNGSQDNKAHSTSGTWTYKANTVTMTATFNDGKPAQKSSPRSMVVGKDGKSMVMTVDSGASKAAQSKTQMQPPTVKVIFKKVS